MSFFFPAFITLSALCFGYITWRDRTLATLLFVALLPTYLIRFSIGPIPTTLLETFFMLLCVSWLLKKEYRSIPTELYTKGTAWTVSGLLLLLVVTISIVSAKMSLDAFNIAKSYFIEPLLFVGILLSLFRKRADWRRLLLALSLTAIPLALIAIAQRFFGAPIPPPWDYSLRATSVFTYPNALGLYLAPIATISALFLITLKERIWIAPLIASVIGLLLAQTEASYIAVPSAILLAFAWRSERKQRVVLIGAMMVALTLALIIPQTRTKLLLQDYSGTVRQAQWQETVILIKNRPILGAGLNQYPEAIIPHHTNSHIERFQYPHNIVLNTWVELGLAGVLIFLTILFLIARSLLRQSPEPLPVVTLGALLVMLIHGLVDVPYFKNDLAFLTMTIIALVIFLDVRGHQVASLKARKSIN